MKKLLHPFNRQNLTRFFIAALITSLVYSPFTLSVSMIALMVLSFFNWQWRAPWLGLNRDFWRSIGRFPRHPDFAAVLLFFFIVLLSAPFTDDWEYWFSRLRLKLPFLMLPIAFLTFRSLSRRQYYGLYYFTVWMLVATCIGIGVNYLLHFEAVNAMIEKGQPMPVPRNHIRFSLVLALGVIAGGVLYLNGYYWRYRRERPLLAAATVFLFFFIHLLSVRSGLLALYAAIAVLTVQYIVRTRRWLIGLVALGGLLLLPVLSYLLLPSFRTKVDYVRWDLLQYQEGKGAQYSDSERLLSLQVGMELGNQNPWLGVGLGNLRQEVLSVYAAEHPEIAQPKMPHNQFVSLYAGAGVVGLAIFGFAFCFPLFYRKHYREPLFLAFYVIVFISFLVENTIENAIGIGFFAVFLLMGLNHARSEDGRG